MDTLFLSETELFRGISERDTASMLACLDSREKRYEKGSTVFHAGACVESMGMVLTGSVNIEMDDFWGNRTILGHVEAGGLFAETYACIPGEPLMVRVVACEKSEILFLSATRLLTTCSDACDCHNQLIRNLLRISAQKNLALSGRSLHTSSKTIRGRLLSYLSEQAKRTGSDRFTIPYNRQQLADYLGVDRSAMSHELSKMQSEHLLKTEKNRFQLARGE